jgi:hypothetical protein
MKASIRPSGEIAGEVAESVKFVSCTHSEGAPDRFCGER